VPWPDECRCAERRHFWQLCRQASRAPGINCREDPSALPSFFPRRQHLENFIIMSNPHDLSDGRAVTHDPYVPALDGLRGVAALLVAGAHYMTMEALRCRRLCRR
jgi:hypothetical protein